MTMSTAELTMRQQQLRELVMLAGHLDLIRVYAARVGASERDIRVVHECLARSGGDTWGSSLRVAGSSSTNGQALR
jgi:hypothetical protein